MPVGLHSASSVQGSPAAGGGSSSRGQPASATMAAMAETKTVTRTLEG